MIRILLVIVIIVAVVAFASFRHVHRDGNLVRPTTELSAWSFYAFPPAKAAMTQDGDALRCEVQEPGAVDNAVVMYQTTMTVENHHTYRVRFMAKADRNFTIRVDSSVDHMKYDDIGLTVRAPLTREWQQFEYIFVGRNADGQRDRAPTFATGLEPVTYWVKNVMVEEVN